MSNISLECMLKLCAIKKSIDLAIVNDDKDKALEILELSCLEFKELDLSPLTRRQEEIFLFVLKTIANTGMPPTRSEISSHFGFRSINSAHEHLKKIEKKGYITLKTGFSRSIHLNAI